MIIGSYTTLAGNTLPGQPLVGPGGAEYCHESVTFYDFAKKSDGYWLFEPASPRPDSANVIIFMHGYGAYNPMAYGKWIKHLVGKGNIVIYPRYQKNLLFPTANCFPKTASKGIRDALKRLENDGHVKPRLQNVMYVGHSYGGTICANLAVNWQEHNIPKPAGLMLCQPGTGPLKGALLDDYSGLPSDLNLLILVGEHDFVVGHTLGKLVFETAVNTPNRNFLCHYRDSDGSRTISATHSEPYCYDLDFDTGVRNYTTQRVLFTSRLDEVDFNCYWKLFDGLCDYTREGKNREVAFGNTVQQRFVGKWSNGSAMREMQVVLPL